ncbi:MAG: KpsF/GutQ family sugar-phosphate isomerase [Alphaproteobacteria bacterium]|nr:MAG: KpsF/GutQ family sugar-phosphate isomerase [Alphaproteobacteria bacterium]
MGGRISNPAEHSTQNALIEQDKSVGRRVLETEAEALSALGNALDSSFSAAIDALLGVKGRVIVSGLGKSGHIARKIAATLASTGTPAQHVHPSEASHGDLGMITRDDVVIMLSNSGENRELSDLIAHTRLYNIKLIGISSRLDSTLMKASDICLLLPEAPEACPMGMAPTTSSTMMLALGDALAVALMERRGFSKDDYRVLHPGGQLGKALIRIETIMHTGDKVPLVTGNVPMADLLGVLVAMRFGCVGITNDQGALIGIFTDGDLGRNISADLMNKTAFDVMTTNPKVITSDALVAEAIRMMEDKKVSCLFVMPPDDAATGAGRPVGIVHMHDCIGAGIG